MPRISEAVEISAPVEQVWRAVHVDIGSIPAWSQNLTRCEVVGGGRLEVGSHLLYVARLPAGRTYDLDLTVKVYDEFKRCSGTLETGQLTGTWSWTYRSTARTTRVAYTTEVKVRGLLRVTGALVQGQIEQDVRRNLQALKRFVEGQ